jgi:hypothetical protein
MDFMGWSTGAMAKRYQHITREPATGHRPTVETKGPPMILGGLSPLVNPCGEGRDRTADLSVTIEPADYDQIPVRDRIVVGNELGDVRYTGLSVKAIWSAAVVIVLVGVGVAGVVAAGLRRRRRPSK